MSATSKRPIARFAALVAVAALPLAALALGVVNLLQAAELDALAERQEAPVAALERRAEAAAGRAPVRDTSSIYVPGATPALAKAGLQRLLVDAVDGVAGRLIEAEDAAAGASAPEDASDGRVRLRIAFDARNGALLDLLHALETRTPLLTIEKVEVRRLDAGADGDAEDPQLRVGLIVAGALKEVGG